MLQAIVKNWIAGFHRRLWIMATMGLMLTCQWVISDDNVDQLIGSLDSPQFAVRESATRQLVEMGGPALRKLAQHYFASSPEKAWRIKRVLEDIGTTNDDPDTCFKSIGILFVLDSNVGDRIVELLNDWKENRSKKAVEYLQARGARFSNEFMGINRQIGVLDVDIREVLERELKAREQQTQSESKTVTSQPAENDPKIVYEKVNQILNGSLADNENFVWELYKQLQSEVSVDPLENNRNLLAGNPIIMNRRDQIFLQPNGVAFNFASSTGVLVTLDENWQGDAEDLKRLNQIYQLSGLRFKDRNIMLEEAAVVSELNQLQYLAINGCETNGFKLHDLTLPNSIQVIDLGMFQLDEPTVRMLAKLKLISLRMDECEISPGAVEAFSSLASIRELSWTRTPISSDLFDAMAKLPALQTINLSVSKFLHEDKKRFDQQRPSCRFNNVPVAFLGVQGPQTISSYQREEDCLIEQVVADSSAAKAGIEPGDIIRKVSGQPIEKFEELRMFITQHSAGESLELDVEREGKIITIPVELGSIDEALVR